MELKLSPATDPADARRFLPLLLALLTLPEVDPRRDDAEAEAPFLPDEVEAFRLFDAALMLVFALLLLLLVVFKGP